MFWVILYIVVGAGVGGFITGAGDLAHYDIVPLTLASTLFWPLVLAWFAARALGRFLNEVLGL